MGTPKQELLLTKALTRAAPRIAPPGPGRSLFTLLEPAVERGRPDAIFFAASRQGVDAFVRAGLRLPSPAAARLLDSTESDAGLSPRYARALRRQLETAGWSRNVASRFASLVHQSAAFECKVEDGKRAVRQAAHFRRCADQAYVVMPSQRAPRVPRPSLALYGIGLLEVLPSGAVVETVASATKPASVAQRLWLLELLLRHTESAAQLHTLSSAEVTQGDGHIVDSSPVP